MEIFNNLSDHEEQDLLIYGVPEEAIALVNMYRNNGHPEANILIPLADKVKKIFAVKNKQEYEVNYYILLKKYPSDIEYKIEEIDKREIVRIIK